MRLSEKREESVCLSDSFCLFGFGSELSGCCSCTRLLLSPGLPCFAIVAVTVAIVVVVVVNFASLIGPNNNKLMPLSSHLAAN